MLKKNKFIIKKEVLRKTKMVVFNTMHKPVLTYKCKSWVLSREKKSKIQALEMM